MRRGTFRIDAYGLLPICLVVMVPCSNACNVSTCILRRATSPSRSMGAILLISALLIRTQSSIPKAVDVFFCAVWHMAYTARGPINRQAGNAGSRRMVIRRGAVSSIVPSHVSRLKWSHYSRISIKRVPSILHSRCKMTIRPMMPNMTVFNHGCSLSMIVTYPTAGTYPRTLPIISAFLSK